MENKSGRKVRTGVVVSNKMHKTAVVRVENTVRHPQFGKVVKRAKKYYAHVETPVEIGQTVTIEETRPMSKLKRWRVLGAKA
ncbi:MAG: 30S ribosomal protein S17 [Verrucomicrobia bacterium]|nr:30S ribosomal protein S17 [Verrucomicrobiota bacterium]